MTEEIEIRLFDGQWVDVYNKCCYAGYTVEDAVVKAVQLTEKAMAKNYAEGRWPKTDKGG